MVDFEKNRSNFLAKILEEKRLHKARQKAIIRTQKSFASIIFANNFELFVTLTYDPRKLKHYTYESASSRLQGWLRRQRRVSLEAGKEFCYVVIPDVSSNSNLIQFHLLASGYSSSLKDANIVLEGRLLYKMPAFRYGFSKAFSLLGATSQDIASLVFPYLEKNAVCERTSSRTYWCSRNLTTLDEYENRARRLDLSQSLDPLLKLGVLDISAENRLK